jgi:hypothetical protein
VNEWLQHGTELLGKRVAVKLDEHVIVIGKLLAFSDMGTVEIQEDDGDIHHCWPMLEVEAAPLPAHEPGPPMSNWSPEPWELE